MFIVINNHVFNVEQIKFAKISKPSGLLRVGFVDGTEEAFNIDFDEFVKLLKKALNIEEV